MSNLKIFAKVFLVIESIVKWLIFFLICVIPSALDTVPKTLFWIILFMAAFGSSFSAVLYSKLEKNNLDKKITEKQKTEILVYSFISFLCLNIIGSILTIIYIWKCKGKEVENKK